MLQPEYLSTVAEPLVDIFSELQMRIQADIARRIMESGELTATAQWQLVKMRQLGMAQRDMQREIAKTLGVTEQEVARLFRAAGLKSMQSDKALQRELIKAGRLPKGITPLGASEAFRQVMAANARRTMNTLKRLTGTIAIDATGKLNQYMDMAQMMTQSGAFTQEQAIQTAVERFANDGVYAFDYFSGVRTSIEAAVRRALVTGVNQAIAEVSLSNAEELGTDLVEVTSHADSRPTHAVWQGGIYSISGSHPKYKKLSDATGYGTVTGLCGANCRHSFYAFVEGISEQLPKEAYSQETYEQEQESRYNERQIRNWKRKAATLEAGGQDATKAKAKVREWQARQKEHIAKTGLTREYNREKIHLGIAKPLKDGILKSSDIQIGRSLGAAARRDSVLLPSGNRGRVAEGTEIKRVVTFAGKGTDKQIRVANHLSKQYGGAISDWKKVRGDGYVVCDDGKTRRSELHWFENESIGRVQMKVKRYFDEG